MKDSQAITLNRPAIGGWSLASVWRRQRARLGQWTSRGALAILDQGLISGANFFLSVVLARWLSPAEYGHFAVVLAILLFFAGSYQALLLFPMTIGAPQLTQGEREAYLGGMHHLLKRICAGLLCGAAGLAVLQAVFGQGSWGSAASAAIALPPLLLHWQARDFHYLTLAPRHSAQAAGIYAAVLMGGSLGLRSTGQVTLPNAMLLMAAGAAAAASWLLYTMPFCLKRDAATWSMARTLREGWRIGRWEFLVHLTFWLPTQAIFPAVTGVLGATQAGALRALQNLSTPLLQIHTAIHRLAQPYFSAKLTATAERQRARTGIGRVALLGMAAGIVYMLVFGCLGRPVLTLLYGQGKFEQHDNLLALSIAPSVLFGVALGFATGLRALHRFPTVLRMFGTGTVAFALFVIPLSREYGLAGTLTAATLGNAISLVWAIAAFLRATKDFAKP